MIVVSMAMLKEQRLHMKLFAFHLLRILVSKAESEKVPEPSQVFEIQQSSKRSGRKQEKSRSESGCTS